eukprot:scaffold8753_cov19-Prasinocladus_malaysianus.AAC.1
MRDCLTMLQLHRMASNIMSQRTECLNQSMASPAQLLMSVKILTSKLRWHVNVATSTAGIRNQNIHHWPA